MIQELGDMVNSLAVSGWQIGIGIGYAVIGVGLAAGAWEAMKQVHKDRTEFDALRDSYRDGMDAQELERFYIRLSALEIWFGKRGRQSDELKKKVVAHLEPIIDAEIREAVMAHEGMLPRGERMRDMSPTYRRIRAGYLSENIL